MPSWTKRLVPGALAIACAAACQNSLDKLCPPDSTPAGNFALVLTLRSSAQQCTAHELDGGPADANWTPTKPQLASLCQGPGADGGPLVYLAVQNQVPRDSPLGPNGEVTFQTSSKNVSQTPCGCAIDYVETIAGVLVPAGDGGVHVEPDGGLSPIASIDGSVVDQLSMSAGASGCKCNLPCDLQYQLVGARQQ
jgi:hypothetical protein